MMEEQSKEPHLMLNMYETIDTWITIKHLFPKTVQRIEIHGTFHEIYST